MNVKVTSIILLCNVITVMSLFISYIIEETISFTVRHVFTTGGTAAVVLVLPPRIRFRIHSIVASIIGLQFPMLLALMYALLARLILKDSFRRETGTKHIIWLFLAHLVHLPIISAFSMIKLLCASHSDVLSLIINSCLVAFAYLIVHFLKASVSLLLSFDTSREELILYFLSIVFIILAVFLVPYYLFTLYTFS